jgi:hypothetical protein
MNKKLIKELKKVGFEFNDSMDKDYLRLCHEGNASFIRYVPSIRKLLFFKSDASKAYCTEYLNTFDQIAEKVLEVTLKPLKPKQTKRQEIYTLRESVKMLDKENHEMGVYIAKNEKENQELGKRIDVLEKDKAIKELEGLRHLIDTGQATPNTTKAEPKSEPEKTEGGFKVGAPVVLNPVIDFSINSIKLEAAAQTVFTVSGTNTNCFYLSKNGKPFFKDILFYECELLNAPIKRIFETGNRVVVKPRNTYAFGCSDSKRNVAKYSAILIIQNICGNNSVAGGLEIETDNGRYTVGELQHAPKEAAKALKFGDGAIIVENNSDHEFELGQVVLVGKYYSDGAYYQCFGIGCDWSVIPEDLKAL